MASGQRSTWPIVLLLGLCISLLIGTAAAVAAPSEDGRPWWHEDEPQTITGHVVAIDTAEGTALLDELVSYEVGGIGELTVHVANVDSAHVGETVDVTVTRHDGTWRAEQLVLLDTD
jgi:hypothetical protein